MRYWTIIILLLLAACAPQETTETVYRVGAIQPLSGDGSVYGLPVQRVVQQAVKDLNEQWKDKNQRIEVIYEDGKCSGKDALSAAQNLVNLRGIKVIYGGTCSSETLGLAPFTEENKILVFSPLSSSPEITNAGDYVFRNYPSDTAQVEAMLPFMEEGGYKKIAILSENTDYAQALRKSYAASMESISAELVADEVVAPNTKDVRTEISKIKAKNPDAIIALPQTVPTAGVFAKQLFESKVDAQVLGNEVMGLEQTIDEYGKMVEGYFTPSSVFEKENSEEFINLKDKIDCELSFYCATTYDGVFLLGELLEKCGDQDTDCMRDALYATKGWEGLLSGKTTFDENGDVPGSFQVNEIVDGKLVKVR
ncbi:MAG: ABC transporter substrate-binding protein [Candidatus Nanoarchaeia archaeon]